MSSVGNIETRSRMLSTIDSSGPELIRSAKTVYSTPETGFNEYQTSKYILERLESLGLTVETDLARTGMKAILRGNSSGPTVALIAEIDALRVPEHPGADPDTGVAHACGHHSQTGSLLGVATALTLPGIRDCLSGNVAFIVTPAEEFIDIRERLALRSEGKLEFLSGKQEMIRLGVFDDVDMAMMIHTAAGTSDATFSVGGSTNAHVSHQVRYIGKSAHAGGAPDQGVNALQAAMLANHAINSQRETFKESDVVRVHGIIARGGASVSAVPSDVLYEGRIRARSPETVQLMAEKIIRCYKAGAMAMGASVEIQTVAGYFPLNQSVVLQEIFTDTAKSALGRDSVTVMDDLHVNGGSTDMGDLSAIMPVIHPYVNAATGTAHGGDYTVDNYDRAVLITAKTLAATILELLSDGADQARNVLAGFNPLLSADQYVTAQRERFSSELFEFE